MNKKLIGLSVAVVVIAILGAYQYPKVDVSKLSAQFGGIGQRSSATADCVEQNGVMRCVYKKPLTTATTTVCAFKSPNATSTLVRSSVLITVASSTATTWTLAKATTPYATTTYIDSFSLSSAVTGDMISVASTTAVVDPPQVMGPNRYVVWGMAGIGSSYDSSKLTGSCEAEFLLN